MLTLRFFLHLDFGLSLFADGFVMLVIFLLQSDEFLNCVISVLHANVACFAGGGQHISVDLRVRVSISAEVRYFFIEIDT